MPTLAWSIGLMGLAHGLGHQVQTQMMQGAALEDKQKQLFSNMDMLLKIVRQFDRLAQIERQLGAPPPDKSAAPLTSSGMVAGAWALSTLRSRCRDPLDQSSRGDCPGREKTRI
jgi:hypothetical protein